MITVGLSMALYVGALVYLCHSIRPILLVCTLHLAFVLVARHICLGTEKLTVSILADSLPEHRSASCRP